MLNLGLDVAIGVKRIFSPSLIIASKQNITLGLDVAIGLKHRYLFSKFDDC